MTRTARMLVGAWVVLLGWGILVVMLAKVVGRVPLWAVSFLTVPYVGESIRYFYILLAPITIAYGIRSLYCRGMKSR